MEASSCACWRAVSTELRAVVRGHQLQLGCREAAAQRRRLLHAPVLVLLQKAYSQRIISRDSSQMSLSEFLEHLLLPQASCQQGRAVQTSEYHALLPKAALAAAVQVCATVARRTTSLG